MKLITMTHLDHKITRLLYILVIPYFILEYCIRNCVPWLIWFILNVQYYYVRNFKTEYYFKKENHAILICQLTQRDLPAVIIHMLFWHYTGCHDIYVSSAHAILYLTNGIKNGRYIIRSLYNYLIRSVDHH